MARARQAMAALAFALLASVAFAARAAQIAVQDTTISFLESDGSSSATVDVAQGARAAKRLRLDHTQTLKLTFKVLVDGEAARPQQAFLRLTAVASGDAAYFSALKTKDGSLSVTATVAGVQKQIGVQGGEYSAALLLGGTDVANPMEWELASLDVLLPPRDDGSQPPSQPLHATQELFGAKPEIKHAHRAPERRAPAIVPLLFVGATLAPLAALGVVLLRLGANVKALPTGGAGALWALGFHGGLAATLALLFLFWLRLTLMQLLPLLGGLGAFTAACGSRALAHASAARKKAE